MAGAVRRHGRQWSGPAGWWVASVVVVVVVVVVTVAVAAVAVAVAAAAAVAVVVFVCSLLVKTKTVTPLRFPWGACCCWGRLKQQTRSQFLLLPSTGNKNSILKGGVQNNRRGHCFCFYSKG